MDERDYIIQLRDLVLKINSNLGSFTYSTNKLLNEATKWELPSRYKEEKPLLTYLIDRGRELVQLKRIASRHFLSKELFENYFSLSRWFKSLQMLLDTFDVPLYKVSFDDLTLKEG